MMKATRKGLWVAAVAAIGIAAVSAVVAQTTAPADVIKSRQKHLKDTGAAFKTIRDQVRVSVPDVSAIKAAAAEIKKTADAMSTWFPKGSGTEVGVKTAAKPEIWSDPSEFSAAQKNFAEVAAKFAQTANGGDVEVIKAQIGSMGQACKRCHDKYRVKED